MSNIVIPGDFIGVIEEYQGKDGVYIKDGRLYSKILGVLVKDEFTVSVRGLSLVHTYRLFTKIKGEVYVFFI